MKKRLLLVTSGYPFGESERGFLSEEAKELASIFELHIMAMDNQDELLYPTDGIVHIERYHLSSSFKKSRNLQALLRVFHPETLAEAWALAKKHHYKNAIHDLRHILFVRFNVWEMEEQIARLVQEKKIDMVYTYWCNECTIAAVNLKKRFPHLKVVTRFHGMDLYEERKAENWQPFRKKIARLADGLCFACTYGRTYFREHWGERYADKMHLWYLGSKDRGQLDAPVGETLRIISCSNLIPLKRVDLIIEALTKLPETVQIAWDHFGDGVEREKLETLAKEKLENSNISWKFHGFVPNNELAKAYRQIQPNLFITTSSSEGGAPVSIQEAFSMGIPAIGTPIGGIPDLIEEGKTGYLLPQQASAEDVASVIMKYAALNGQQKKDMASAARRAWNEKFDAEKNAVAFTAYLRNLLSD